MKLTGKCKEVFTEWYKNFDPKSDWKYPAFEYFENHDVFYQVALLTMFFDRNDIHIMVEPHISGGAPMFYGKVIYRNERFIDCQEDVMNGPEPQYTDVRTEMSMLTLDLAIEIFNINFYKEDEEMEINDLRDELDDLPF